MVESTDGRIVIMRCPLSNECINVSNVFSIFEHFHLRPTEHILDKIIFKELLLVVKSADFVILVACEHLTLKLKSILQCLKVNKTVITGNFNAMHVPETFNHFRMFNTTHINSLASYVHDNFNYDSLSRKVKNIIKDSNFNDELIEPLTKSSYSGEHKPRDIENDVDSFTEQHIGPELRCLTTFPIMEEYLYYPDTHLDVSLYDDIHKGSDEMMDPYTDNTEKSMVVVILKCILQDRCTCAFNLHETLEKHGLTTTDFVIETNILNLELPNAISKSDFVVLVICKHLQPNLRKIKRYLQEVSRRVLITGDLHGPHTKQIFEGFTLFRMDDAVNITMHIKNYIANASQEMHKSSKNYSLEGFVAQNPDYHLDQKRRFVSASSLTESDNTTGAFVSVSVCFPKVTIKTESLDNLKRRFYTVGNDEKKDLVKQIQNMTIKSLRLNCDFLGLIILLGVADYHIQDNIIKALNQVQLEDNLMSRCLRGKELLNAARWLIGIVKSNFGDSHIMMSLIPVAIDTIAMLYLSTLTITTLGDKLDEEIRLFCTEAEKTTCSILTSYASDCKDALFDLITSLRRLLVDFKSRVGCSKALQLGNLKDALSIPENRRRISKHFESTMCYLEQYTCLLLVANQLMKSTDIEMVDFFDELVRKLLRKAKKKQKIEDVLFSSLHLVTKTVVGKLEKEDYCIAPAEIKMKLGDILTLFLDKHRPYTSVKQSSRDRLVSMIKCLLLNQTQHITDHTIYLFREHGESAVEIRNFVFQLVEDKLTAVNFKIRKPGVRLTEDVIKPEWITLNGTIWEDIDTVLNILVPTLNCLSKGDVNDYVVNARKEQSDRYMNELHLLCTLQELSSHRNIVQLFAFHSCSIPIFYVTEKSCGPDLLAFLLNNRSNNNRLQEQQLLRMIIDIMNAVLFLHDNEIIHRNITCCAFSIRQSDSSVFLHDLSIASILKSKGGYISDVETVGIPVLWSAPESIFEDRYDKRTDAWMMGNIMYEVFTVGCHPYTEIYNTSVEQILEYVLFRDLKLYKWPCIPAEIHDIILALTATDPNERSLISESKAKIDKIKRKNETNIRGSRLSLTVYSTETLYFPELDVNQGAPDRIIPELFNKLRGQYGHSSSATKCSGNSYINFRISQRLYRNTLAVTPGDLTAPDKPRILKRFGFLDVREPVTLQFLRLLPNIDEDTYKNVLCLFDSPQRHLTQARQKMQQQNFSFYLKYKTSRGTNIFDLAFTHRFGNPEFHFKRYARVVIQMVQFVYEMHRRRWILCDICAENLYLAEDKEQVFMPRLGRMLFFDGTNGSDDCIVGNVFQDRRRWNPIEVLQHGQYSFESDIYRLAMSIYEFYTALDIHSIDPMADQLHCAPFSNFENEELLDMLYNGIVPQKPKFCPEKLYGILRTCWNRDRTQRPSALWLKDIISRQLADSFPDTEYSLLYTKSDEETQRTESPQPELPARPVTLHNHKESIPYQTETRNGEYTPHFSLSRHLKGRTQYKQAPIKERSLSYRNLSHHADDESKTFLVRCQSFEDILSKETHQNDNDEKSTCNEVKDLRDIQQNTQTPRQVTNIQKRKKQIINQASQKPVVIFKNIVEELQHKISSGLNSIPSQNEVQNAESNGNDTENSSESYIYLTPVV